MHRSSPVGNLVVSKVGFSTTHRIFGNGPAEASIALIQATHLTSINYRAGFRWQAASDIIIVVVQTPNTSRSSKISDLCGDAPLLSSVPARARSEGSMWLGRPFSILTHCYKRCDFFVIGSCKSSLTSMFIHPASALQSAAVRKALMQDPFQACSNPLTIIVAIHRTKPCSMYPVRWRNHETGCSRAIGADSPPTFTCRSFPGRAGGDRVFGSFAGYVRRTAASKERNAGGGAIWQLPARHLPLPPPDAGAGRPAMPVLLLLLHKRVELNAGTGSPDVNTVAKRAN